MTLIFSNARRRFIAATSLIKLAEIKGTSNTRKSLFYQSAILLFCSIAEGLAYALVKKHIADNGCQMEKTTEYKEMQKICLTDSSVLVDPDLFICKKVKKDLSPDEADFGKFIIFLKNNNLVSYARYKQLNWIRKERNKIHLQGIKSKDIGYTKDKLNRIGDSISYLVDKLEEV